MTFWDVFGLLIAICIAALALFWIGVVAFGLYKLLTFAGRKLKSALGVETP